MKISELLEAIRPLAVDFTNQYLEDNKQYFHSAPHIRESVKRFIEFKINNPTRPISKKDSQFSGQLSRYRHVHLSGDIFLIYLIEGGTLLLVRIAQHDEIKIKKQKQLRKSLNGIVNRHNQ